MFSFFFLNNLWTKESPLTDPRGLQAAEQATGLSTSLAHCWCNCSCGQEMKGAGRGSSQLKGPTYGHGLLSLPVLSLESNHGNPNKDGLMPTLIPVAAQSQSNGLRNNLGTPRHSGPDHRSPSGLRPPCPIRCTLLSKDVLFWSHLFWPWDPLPLCSISDILKWSPSLTLRTKGKGKEKAVQFSLQAP